MNIKQVDENNIRMTAAENNAYHDVNKAADLMVILAAMEVSQQAHCRDAGGCDGVRPANNKCWE